jgi:hypothetical protein
LFTSHVYEELSSQKTDLGIAGVNGEPLFVRLESAWRVSAPFQQAHIAEHIISVVRSQSGGSSTVVQSRFELTHGRVGLGQGVQNGWLILIKLEGLLEKKDGLSVIVD